MSEVTTIGLDIAKYVFHAQGADKRGRAIFSKRISSGKLLDFFATRPRCLVALEACGGAHHWARELVGLGHEVRLIPPAYVKPFVKRHKSDAADAEAICEAAQRPSMRFVAVKSEEQQAAGLVFRTRDLLVRQRTQLINAIRGHLTEYGWIAPKGLAHIATLADLLEEGAKESPLPEAARSMVRLMLNLVADLDAKIADLDKDIARRSREDAISRRLMTIPGVGPITAAALAALAPPAESFAKGRDFAAWLGFTPLQKSTGGKQKLGAISKMGERTLRRLLIIGSSAVVLQASRRGAPKGSWLEQMLARKPRMLITVASKRTLRRPEKERFLPFSSGAGAASPTFRGSVASRRYRTSDSSIRTHLQFLVDKIVQIDEPLKMKQVSRYGYPLFGIAFTATNLKTIRNLRGSILLQNQ